MRSYIEGVYFSQDRNVNYKLSKADINSWVTAINYELGGTHSTKRFISLRLVNSEKMQELNYNFRRKNESTNVLAFPTQLNDGKEINNLLGDIKSTEEFEDSNCIKVVCDQQNNAIYFSREPIPTRNKTDGIPMKKQVCIIPFTRKFLLEYTAMDPTPLEISESIDMLRVLENGKQVKMVPTKFQTYPVDTEEDLKRVEELMCAEN